jgi:hypothetical protein
MVALQDALMTRNLILPEIQASLSPAEAPRQAPGGMDPSTWPRSFSESTSSSAPSSFSLTGESRRPQP